MRSNVLVANLFFVGFLCGIAGGDDEKKWQREFNVAAALQNAQLFERAADRWEELLKKYPGFEKEADAIYYLALCHVEVKQFDRAKKWIDELTKKHPEFSKNEKGAARLERITQRIKAKNEPAPKRPKTFTNSIGMKFKLLPAGEFLKGSHESMDRLAQIFDSKYGPTGPCPPKETKIKEPFYLGVYEVKHSQFRAFVDATGYKTDAESGGPGARFYNEETGIIDTGKEHCHWQSVGWKQTDQHPVVNISWNDAKAFCRWLSEKEGRKYRLPTSSEWEYACRAGTVTRYSCGDDWDKLVKFANVGDSTMLEFLPGHNLLSGGRFKANDKYAFSAPVGSFKPNPFGLYDMHGNAWEWVDDVKEKDIAVARGGGWTSFPLRLRSAQWAVYDQDFSNFAYGFRVALPVEPSPKAPVETTDVEPDTISVPDENPLNEIVIQSPSLVAIDIAPLPPSQVLQAAFDERATLSDFNGMRARVSIVHDNEHFFGTAVIDAKGLVEIKSPEKTSDNLKRWSAKQISDVITNHLPQKIEGEEFRRIDEKGEHPFSQIIASKHGDRVFRIGVGGIREAVLKENEHTFTMTVLGVERIWSDKFVIRSTSSIERGKSGEVEATETRSIDWTRVAGNMYLPKKIVVLTSDENGSQISRITLSDLRLKK